MPPEGRAGAQSVEKATVDRENGLLRSGRCRRILMPPRASATGDSEPDARRTGSAPSVPLSRSSDRQGYLGPATAGFIGGLISAGIVAAGLFAFGPASDLGDRLSAMNQPSATRRPEERSKLSTSGPQPSKLRCNRSGRIWTSSPSVRRHLTSGPSTAASIGWSAAFRKWHRGQRNPPLDRSSPHRPGPLPRRKRPASPYRCWFVTRYPAVRPSATKSPPSKPLVQTHRLWPA